VVVVVVVVDELPQPAAATVRIEPRQAAA